MTILPIIPPADLMTLWAVTWRDAGLMTHVTSPGPGLSCIFLWRRHYIVAPYTGGSSGWPGAPGCCVITGTQGQADSRLLLPWRDAGQSEVIIQLSDLSPTSCLRIPAHFSHSHGWSVIYIASGQSQYIVKSQILIWMYLFRFFWSLSLSVITSVKRQTETKLELLGPEGNLGLKLSR